jgi:hypothetical protein
MPHIERRIDRHWYADLDDDRLSHRLLSSCGTLKRQVSFDAPLGKRLDRDGVLRRFLGRRISITEDGQ